MDFPRPDGAVEQKFLLDIFSEVGSAVAEMSPPDSYSARFKYRRTWHPSTWKLSRTHRYWVLRRFFYYDYLLLEDGSYGILVRSRPSREKRRGGAFPMGFWALDHLDPYGLAFVIETTDLPLFEETAKKILLSHIGNSGYSWQLANSIGQSEEWERKRSVTD